MNHYDNIPKCIREGIFCLMTGSMIFLGNGISAEAAEAPAEPDLPQNDAHDSAAETKAEAAELISTPSEPSASTEPQVTQTPAATVTTTTNTYVEETPSAVAVTEETVKETVANPDALTKNTTNVTVTVTEDGNTTTTTGNYNEDVYTKETSSTTIITTSDDVLAKELESQIKDNADNKDIEVSEKYFVTDKDGNPVDITDKASELKKKMKTDDIEDATYIVETKDGKSTVSYQIEDEAVPLSPSASKVILNAKQSIIEQKNIYSIGGNEITSEQLTKLLDEYSLSSDTVFSIVPTTGNDVKITFTDADGKTCEVTNEELINLILNNAKVSETTTFTEDYKGKQEYESEEAAKQEMDQAIAAGYTNVKTSEGTTTHTVSYTDPTEYTSLQDAIDAGDNLKKIENGGYTNILIDDQSTTTSSGYTTIKDFNGFKITSETEYNRISKLNTIDVDGQTLYVEIDPNTGTETYYKLDKIEKSFTILAKEGAMEQHQEDCYIIGDKYYYYNSNNGRESSNEYGVDFETYENEMNQKLAVEKTDENTLRWNKEGKYFYGEYKIEVTHGGTYYVNASVAGRLHLATSEEVTIILYNKSGDTVYVPTATTKFDYQPNQTHTVNNQKPDFGNVTPNLTFVTKANYVLLTSNNNLGNILATDSNVNILGGNFSGTIICKKIFGWGEGHINPNGTVGYLVDSQTKTSTTTTTSKYIVSASKEVKNLIVTGVKEIETIFKTASIEKSEYTKSVATIDKVTTVKFSQYSKESKGGTWTETKTVDVPPTPPTPPVIPPTPPVIPPTPPVVPPTDPSNPPSENIIIIDDDTPLAAEVAQVLGAKRDTPAVLGARRARTGDMAQDPLFAALMIMGASSTALGALTAGRKKR